MTPTQFVRQRLTNWKCRKKFTHIDQVRTAEPFSKLRGQILSEVIQQFCPILGFRIAILFIFYNMTTDLPIGMLETPVYGFQPAMSLFALQDSCTHCFGLGLSLFLFRSFSSFSLQPANKLEIAGLFFAHCKYTFLQCHIMTF